MVFPHGPCLAPIPLLFHSCSGSACSLPILVLPRSLGLPNALGFSDLTIWELFKDQLVLLCLVLHFLLYPPRGDLLPLDPLSTCALQGLCPLALGLSLNLEECSGKSSRSLSASVLASPISMLVTRAYFPGGL